jgi:hypothetical protein
MKKKFGDTKLGTFLKEKAPNVLNTIGHLAGESGIPLVSTIGHVVDSIIPDMKEEVQPLIDDYEKNDLPLLLADLADARNREVQIVTSEKAPLINKVITPVLALIIVGLTFAMWYMLLFKSLPAADKEIILFILGSLSTMCAGVVNYFFGSSSGSKDKSDQIKKLMEQQ